jgi:spore germination protein GerM
VNDDFSGNRPEDRLAARLRDALTSEAVMVQTSDDGLQQIRRGIDAQRQRPWWQHPAAPALAAAAVLGLMVGGVAVFFAGDDNNNPVVGTGNSTSAPSTTSSAPTPSETSSATESSPPAVAERGVYVYYAHDDGTGVRLYREKHSRNSPSAEAVPRTALDEMINGKAVDPDYSSLWSGVALRDYSVSGDVATVDVSSFPKVGAEAETVAVQELVYTVTANNPAVKSVRLLVNGKVPASGHIDLSQPVARAPLADVQGWIWLLAPTEGATVSSPVSISGFGTSFEGTINWEVTKDGTKVAEGHTQGGSMGEFGEFSDTVDLDPGTYEIRALEFSAEDGSPIHVDTKTFTVK